MYNSSIYLQI